MTKKLKLWKRPKRDTLVTSLLKASLFVILPLLCYGFYSSYYSIHLIHEQMAKSNQNLISLYISQIDKEFGNINQYLINLAVKTSNDAYVMDSMQDNNRVLSRIQAWNDLDDDLSVYHTSLDAIFVKNDTMGMLTTSSVSSQASVLMREYVVTNIESGQFDAEQEWRLCRVADTDYFLRIVQYDRSYVGAWVNALKIIQPILDMNQSSNGIFSFVSNDFSVTYPAGILNDEEIEAERTDIDTYTLIGKYLLVNEQSMMGNFKLSMYIPNAEILKDLAVLSKLNYLLLIFTVAMLALFSYRLRKGVIKPIQHILKTIQEISCGELDARIVPIFAARELQEVNSAFNKMMHEMKQLKISRYEEQLRKEEAQLRQFQLQVNPHFMMNSLNIIYSLAQTNNNEMIKKVSQYLFKYYQYSLYTGDSDFVELQQEIEQTRSYLLLQEMRFPGKLNWTIDIPGYLNETMIPPFCVQTFVENTVKYSMRPDEPISLVVKVQLIGEGDGAQIQITISDTGPGFPKDVLRKIAKGERLEGHIGIWNIRQRLNLLYKGYASLQFENLEPCGAQVVVTLPFQDRKLYISL